MLHGSRRKVSVPMTAIIQRHGYLLLGKSERLSEARQFYYRAIKRTQDLKAAYAMARIVMP